MNARPAAPLEAILRAAVGLGNGVLSAILFVTAFCIVVPFTPVMPTEGLDPSWRYAANEAVARGMSIGRDVMFTSGPYSSIYSWVFHPDTDTLTMAGALVLALCFGTALVMTFHAARWYVQIALVLTLAALLLDNRDPLFFLYGLMVGVLCWRMASGQSPPDAGTRPWLQWLLLVVLLIGLSLFGQMKTSGILIGIGTMILGGAMFFRHRKPGMAATVLVVPVLAFACFWIASGQDVGSIPPYLVSGVSMTAGYTDAMSIGGKDETMIAYLVAALIVVGSLVVQAPTHMARLFLFLVFSFGLFLAFKGGFVRHDGHALIAGSHVVFAALVLNALYPSMRSVTALFAALLCSFYIDASYAGMSTTDVEYRVKRAYERAWEGAETRYADYPALMARYDEAVQTMRERLDIPPLDGTVDIYSFNQSNLIASGNDWAPRPVFQSYSAYTEDLIAHNVAHLSSARAADNILFRVEPIDGRFPSSMDGASWPHLLDLYDLASLSNDTLYLKKAAEPRGVAERPLPSVRGRIGEPVAVPEGADAVMARIDLRHSMIGKLIGILFKSPAIGITVRTASGAEETYRHIAAIGRAGMLVTPLVRNTHDFGVLYAGHAAPGNRRVTEFTIDVKGDPFLDMFWTPEFDVAFTAVDLPRSADTYELLDFPRPVPLAASTPVIEAERCRGNIDLLDGAAPPPGIATVQGTLRGNGWMFAPGTPDSVPETVRFVLSAPDGDRFTISADRNDRPDVAASFGNPGLIRAGYGFTVALDGLSGPYRLQLGYDEGDTIVVCPGLDSDLMIAE